MYISYFVSLLDSVDITHDTEDTNPRLILLKEEFFRALKLPNFTTVILMVIRFICQSNTGKQEQVLHFLFKVLMNDNEQRVLLLLALSFSL